MILNHRRLRKSLSIFIGFGQRKGELTSPYWRTPASGAPAAGAPSHRRPARQIVERLGQIGFRLTLTMGSF